MNTHGLPHGPKPQPVNDVRVVVPWLRWLVAGLSSKRLGFDPRPPYVGFVVDEPTLGPAFSEHIGFPRQVSFHHSSTPIFIYVLL